MQAKWQHQRFTTSWESQYARPRSSNNTVFVCRRILNSETRRRAFSCDWDNRPALYQALTAFAAQRYAETLLGILETSQEFYNLVVPKRIRSTCMRKPCAPFGLSKCLYTNIACICSKPVSPDLLHSLCHACLFIKLMIDWIITDRVSTTESWILGYSIWLMLTLW
jgi:hypothetical protein